MLIDINYSILQHKCKAYAKEIHIILLRTHLDTCLINCDVLLLTRSVSYYLPMVQERYVVSYALQ